LGETGNADYFPGTLDIGWTQLNDTAQMDAANVCTASMGWQDAGDWDTRAPHLEAAAYLMVLVERFPSLYNTLELGIPGESGNDVPDLLEQAMARTVLFFRKFTLEIAIGSHACSLEEACDQWHSSRASTFLTSSHCNFRPNTEGR
jgi:hypothetical protein